jgi:hypothetical protein
VNIREFNYVEIVILAGTCFYDSSDDTPPNGTLRRVMTGEILPFGSEKYILP